MEFQPKPKDDLQITHTANKRNLDRATFSHSAALSQHLGRCLLPPTVASVGRRTLVRSPSTPFVLFPVQIGARFTASPLRTCGDGVKILTVALYESAPE